MIGNVKWRPFETFEFFDEDEVLIVTDGNEVDIYDCTYGSWLSVRDENLSAVEPHQIKFYITQEQALRMLKC